MANITPAQGVALWFTYLRALQADGGFNTNLSKMDLLTFANAPIAKEFITANQQGQFIDAAKSAPGFDLSTNDLTTYSSFEALLDHFSPLTTYIGVLLQSLAVDPYPGGAAADFWKAPSAAAFPGGSGGAQWKLALAALSSSIPAICFTPALQAKVNTAIDTEQTKMSDVISEIAVLG
jgi:hypothetical protein